MAQVFFLAARKDEGGTGIKLAGGDDGGQAVEVGIGVSGHDDRRAGQGWFARERHKEVRG